MTALLEARDLTAVLPGDAGDVRVLDGGLARRRGRRDRRRHRPVRLRQDHAAARAGAAASRRRPASSPSTASPPRQIAAGSWRGAVALLPQKPAIVEGNVRDNLLLPWRLRVRHGRPAPDDRAARRGARARLGVDDIALDRDAVAAVGRAGGARRASCARC